MNLGDEIDGLCFPEHQVFALSPYTPHTRHFYLGRRANEKAKRQAKHSTRDNVTAQGPNNGGSGIAPSD